MRRWIFLLLALSGCGFHFGQGKLTTKYHTLSVPYVQGDLNGELTAELAKEISRSGGFHYKTSGGELTLLIEIVSKESERIGYRFDREKRKKSKRLVPSEGRLRAVASVTVVEAGSGSIVLGPSRVEVWTDYDHDYFGSTEELMGATRRTADTSLGQLDDLDTAERMAETPLNRVLAKRIVNLLTQTW
jgi:outer membrane lipopolysaccharide assembly protein LptE/RlpB